MEQSLMEEESSREIMKNRLREILRTREWFQKAQFGDADDLNSDLSDLLFKYYGISKDLDWEHEFGVVLKDSWKTRNMEKQDFPSSKYNDYEEDEDEDEYSDEYSEGDSEDYDYDYADFCQGYHDVFKHRLSVFLHEELPTDKKRNPTLMGKQLIIKAKEEGKEIANHVYKNTEAGKEANESLFKNFADHPRTVMFMARISHALS